MIASLHQLISDLYIVTVPEVSDLIRALVRIPGQFENAKGLQALTLSLLTEISAKESFIWSHSDVKGLDENNTYNIHLYSYETWTAVICVIFCN